MAAFVACLGYGVGSVLQSVGARRTAHVAGVDRVALILLQAPYLLGLACDALAFAANVVALQRLPLFLVQSIMTASVGRHRGDRQRAGRAARGRDWLSLAVLGVGLVLLCVTADAENAVRVSIDLPVGHPGQRGAAGRWSGWSACGCPTARRPWSWPRAAGLAWTGVAVASRGVSADRISWPCSPSRWSGPSSCRA